MNELDDAVRELLSQTPPHPRFKELERRARYRRVRQQLTIAAVALVVVVAIVSTVGPLGHRSSGPRIAVSPTTTSQATASACALVTLQRREADLKATEKQLDEALDAALRNHAPSVGTLDARHQAVLRQISDVTYEILEAQIAHGDQPSLEISTPATPSDDCHASTATTTVAPAAWCAQIEALDAQHVHLETLERSVNDQLNTEIAANSPNADLTDAAHQAVLREQSDIQQRILDLEQARPAQAPCRPTAAP